MQFREITHSVGDLWRNAQGLERLYVTCVSVYGKGVCLKRTFISSSDIITLPQGRRGVIQLSLLHPSPSPPSSSSLTFAFLSELRKPSSEVIMGLTYSQSMDLCLGVHEGGGRGALLFFAPPHTAHSSWGNQPAALPLPAWSSSSGEITSCFPSLHPKY